MGYKKWAYKCFIYVVILNILIAFLTLQSTPFKSYALAIIIGAIAAFVINLIGIILGIVSYARNEAGDFKKILGLWGNIGFLVLGFLLQTFGN